MNVCLLKEHLSSFKSSKDWPSLMESLEMRIAWFPKMNGRKEKFENKKSLAGFCAKWKRKRRPLICFGPYCDTQKGQMQSGIAEEHGHVTLNLCIFCFVIDRLWFSNTTKTYKFVWSLSHSFLDCFDLPLVSVLLCWVTSTYFWIKFLVISWAVSQIMRKSWLKLFHVMNSGYYSLLGHFPKKFE